MNQGLTGFPGRQPVTQVGPVPSVSVGRHTSLWPNTGASATAVAVGVNTMGFYQFSAYGSISEIAIECTTLQASNVMTIAVFRDRGGVPAQRAATLLVADMSGTGIKSNAVSFNFGDLPTVWWMAYLSVGGSAASTRNATPAWIRASGTANNEQGLLESNNIGRIGLGVATVSVMPDDVTGRTFVTAASPTTLPLTIVKWA